MKKNKLFAFLTAVTLSAVPAFMQAQDEVEASVKADIVSRYMWRGFDKGGVSIQPQAKVNWQGLSLTAWGSTGLDKEDTQEIDLKLAYAKQGFNVGLIDYWQTGIDTEDRYFYFSQADGAHKIEANIGYTCRWGSLQAYTTILGQDKRPDGKRAYTTYIEGIVPFALGGIDWQLRAGAVPFKSRGTRTQVFIPIIIEEAVNVDSYEYADGPACVMASLRATKTIQLTDNVAMPIFAEIHTNPYMQRANFLLGLSICPF